MAKKTLSHVVKTRDEKGLPHMQTVAREYAHKLARGSCVTRVRRGMSGERHVVLANGVVLVLDLLTAKQLREWRDF